MVLTMLALLLSIALQANEIYDIVPLPQDIRLQKGQPFILDGNVQILTASDLQREALFLRDYIREQTGLELAVTDRHNRKVRTIALTVSPSVTHPEGYRLDVSKDGINILGGSSAGVFYGIQTLRKSLGIAKSQGVFEFPPVTISDAPRFSWRGMHLDCARHFFSVAFVKWPKLITIGSNRSGTIIGTNSDLDDQTPYGGYYTKAEVREIVAYAAERHITVVPEIDMPGHMLAALASYPELGCTGGPYQVGHYWGVYKDVLCVGNPRVYEFVEDVLTEILDLFPSEVIHIGGDETPTEKWELCPKCQALDLQGNTLQGYFTQRVFEFLTAHGRRALGWDELLENHAPQDAMIMSWRGTAPGAKAAEAGHDVVMSPTTHCYFDYQQVEDVLFEPSRCGGFIPIDRVYALDPAPDSLSNAARSHILGVQANLWSEYMTTESTVEYQALPRMSALAEVQWTEPARKDYDAFRRRLTRFTALYERYGYTYAKHLWPERQMPSRWQF